MSGLLEVKKEEPEEEGEDELVSQIDVVYNIVKEEKLDLMEELDVKNVDLLGCDPMAVLSADTVLRIVSFLSPNDLATVGQLNRAWRSLTRRPEVWRRVFINMSGVRMPDYPKLVRVLRSAPLIGRVAMRLGIGVTGLYARLGDELLACTTQVTELFAAEMVNEDSQLVERLLRRWAPSLEVVELDGPSFRAMRTLARLPMPRLTTILVEDTSDDDQEDRDLGMSQLKLVKTKTPLVSFRAGVPDKSRLVKVHCSSSNKVSVSVTLSIIRAHSETLEEVLLDWSECDERPAAAEVMEAVAQCSRLRGVALDCNHKLGLLAGLKELRSLHVWLSQHRDGNGGAHDKCIAIISKLPVTIKHLMLTVYSGDPRLVLQELVRVAPLRLHCLSTLILVWEDAEMAPVAAEALAPLLPHVQFHCVESREEFRRRRSWCKKYGFVGMVSTHSEALEYITEAPFLGPEQTL